MLEDIDAVLLLAELAADVEYLMHEKGIAFLYTAQQAYIKADYDLFKTLFLNLVDNAAKAGASHIQVNGFLSDGTLRHHPGETNSRTQPAQLYTIQITDDGCGIPPEEIQRITEAFYMVDKSRSRKLHGAGLGLFLAQKIAGIHGSRLDFTSDGRSGTTVTIVLTPSVQDTDL